MTERRRATVGFCALAGLGLVFLAGCEPRQAVLNSDDLDKGLILVLPGIDGRTLEDDVAARCLCTERIGLAVEIYDWTRPFAMLGNQTDVEQNRRAAGRLAERIDAYHADHPDRPVFLVGHSGGTAIAVWAAERLGDGYRVEGIVLLASSLSPGYDLAAASVRSRNGIVSFYSPRDVALLGVGTSLFGTMDGPRTEAAGKVGFAAGGGKLYQVGWRPEMARCGNDGGHFACMAGPFVQDYVAPLLTAGQWDESLMSAVREGRAAAKTVAAAG